MYTYTPTFVRNAQIDTIVLDRDAFESRFPWVPEAFEDCRPFLRGALGRDSLSRHAVFLGDESRPRGFRIALATNNDHLFHCFTHHWAPSRVNIAPDARILALHGLDGPALRALGLTDTRPCRIYCRGTRTMLLLNCDFYGRLKGAVRTLAADLSETEPERYPLTLHGAAIHSESGGVCFVGLAGVGKSTTYHALLRATSAPPATGARRFVADDWTFVDLARGRCLSTREQRSHTKATTLLSFWPDVLSSSSDYLMEFGTPSSVTSDSRLLIDLPGLWGASRCVWETPLHLVVVLVREPGVPPVTRLDAQQACQVLEQGGLSVNGPHPYFNNALLVDEAAPLAARRWQAMRLAQQATVMVVNTAYDMRVTIPHIEGALAVPPLGSSLHGDRRLSSVGNPLP